MSAARDFLQALSQAVTARRLYREDHPAIGDATENAYEMLVSLLSGRREPVFSFVEGRVVEGDRPLPEMDGWPRGPDFADAGMGRLEFRRGVTEREFRDFLDLAYRRIHGDGSGSDGGDGGEPAGGDGPGEGGPREGEDGDGESAAAGFRHIHFGPVQIEVREGRSRDPREEAGTVDLRDEAEANRWLHETARESGSVGSLEAEAVVRSLSVALHSGRAPSVPLEGLTGLDQYTTVHSMNVALLSMSLAEEMAYTSEDVYRIGVGALLHDIGKSRTPLEILNKPGKLTDEEFAAVQRHPVDGARMLLESSPDLRLAAVIAYEHHMQGGGGGYPERRYERERHPAARVVQVCDVYDSLRTDRPYRDAMTPAKARGIIRENAERNAFDAEATEKFLEMIDRVEIRIDPDADGANGDHDGTADGEEDYAGGTGARVQPGS